MQEFSWTWNDDWWNTWCEETLATPPIPSKTTLAWSAATSDSFFKEPCTKWVWLSSGNSAFSMYTHMHTCIYMCNIPTAVFYSWLTILCGMWICSLQKPLQTLQWNCNTVRVCVSVLRHLFQPLQENSPKTRTKCTQASEHTRACKYQAGRQYLTGVSRRVPHDLAPCCTIGPGRHER